MTSTSGVDGNVTAAGRRLWTSYINTDVAGSALIKRGASSINLSAGTGRNKQVEEGTDTITDADDGALRELRRKENSYFNRNPYLAGSWALERAQDNAFRANMRWAPSKFDLTQTNRVSPAEGAEHDDSLFQEFRNPVVELGGDITRPLAGGAIKFVGLATRRKRDDFEAYIGRDDLVEAGGEEVGGFEQVVNARRNETIGRVNWTRANLVGLSVEAGIEGALNTLDSAVELDAIQEDGERIRIDLPIDEATVEEKRGEVYFKVGKALSTALRIDGGLNYEFSQLKVRGDAEADRTLKFLKPNLALDWKPDKTWHSRLSIRRTVAQLNFYDFISVAELSNDRVNGGNADLVPQRTWEFRATVDRPILGEGLVKIDMGIDRISMLQDIILTDEGFSAPGNIGSGKRRFFSMNVDAPLQKFGLSGTRLKLSGQLQHTRVHDPISGQARSFSDFYPDWQWQADLRRDAGDFSYGMTISNRDSFTFYRADETDTNWDEGIIGSMFVEYRPTERMAVTFDVDNLFDTGAFRERTFYDPNRSNLEPESFELRERNRHVSFGMTLKHSFGGAGAARVAQPA